MKQKARYVTPRVTGASAMLLEFNIQVKELKNMNPIEGETSDEVFYFES